LYDYCQRVKRTTWEVLSEFRSARIPREYVFDLFPPLRPREFSIASSVEVSSCQNTFAAAQFTSGFHQVHPREIHLCVAIVRYRTKLKIHRKGTCTSYLSGLKSGPHGVLAQSLNSCHFQEIPFVSVLERASFPFLRIQTHQWCVWVQEQVLHLCVLSSSNAYTRVTPVCLAVFVYQLIFDDPRYCIILWLPFCTQGSALSLRMGISCGTTQTPLSRCVFS
jgi:hypothetical protein